MPPGMSFVSSYVSPALRAANTSLLAHSSTAPSKPFIDGPTIDWPDTPLPAMGKRSFTIKMRATSYAPVGQKVSFTSYAYQTAVSGVSYW